MLLQNHKNIKLYDARSVINIHHIYNKNANSLNKLKQISNSDTITFLTETTNTLYDYELHNLPYKGYLCVQTEGFSGGLYEFVDKETNHTYFFDISPGIFVVLQPESILIRKQSILSGKRTIVLVK